MYSDFEWKGAPLSSLTFPIITGLIYLVAVLLLLHLVPEGGFPLERVFLVHNIFLSGLSIVLCGGCIWEIGARAWSEGAVDWMLCENSHVAARGPLYFWSYAFYASKYYELLDTFLAVLNGSRPKHFLLHVYHHALVPVMVWSWLEYRMSLQFIGVILNTFVHIVMYAFFALKVLKVSTPWKRYAAVVVINHHLMGTAMANPLWIYYPICGTLTLMAILPIRGTPYGGWGAASGIRQDQWVAVVFAHVAQQRWRKEIARRKACLHDGDEVYQ